MLQDALCIAAVRKTKKLGMHEDWVITMDTELDKPWI